MSLQQITPVGWAWAEEATYSQAVRMDNRLYTSGIAPFDDAGEVVGVGDIEAQVRQVVASLARVLQAGGSDMNHIIRQTVYLKRPEDIALFVNLRRELYDAPYPASVLVVVTAHAHPDMLIEIACEAACSRPSRQGRHDAGKDPRNSS